MRNSSAIARLIAASEGADDPLDRLACLRAAAWLRWCDGYGATLTGAEATRIAAGGALAEAARGLIRRLSETYPGPVEDARLDYLEEEDGAAWSPIGLGVNAGSQTGAETSKSVKEKLGRYVEDPFGAAAQVGADDLPGLVR